MWIPAAAVGVLGAAAAVILVPVLPAVRFLRTLSAPEPAWPVEGLRRETDRGSPVLRALAARGSAAARSRVLVAHGVTEKGLDDPRVWRLGAAIRAAGLDAEVPFLRPFVEVRHGLPGAEAVEAEVEGLRARLGPGATGLLAISVGGALALRAATANPPASIFLVGAPDDLADAARGWFRRPDAPPSAAEAEAVRAEAGRFGRFLLLRSALVRLVPEPDRGAIDAWLGDPQGWRVPPRPPGFSPATAEGRRFAGAAAAGPAISEPDRDWILAAVDDLLAALSPARFDAELDRLRCPVFLIHGVDDPLVPVEQMERLRARLAKRVPVEALSSPLLSHVGLGEASLREKWRHVRFVQRFFDAIERGPYDPR